MLPPLFDHLTTAVLLITSDWRIVDANAAAEQLFCYSKKRLKNQTVDTLFPADGLNRKRLQALFDTSETVINHDVAFLQGADTHKMTLSASAISLENHAFLLLECHEITPKNSLKQQTQQQTQQRAAQDLIRGLAHEIKNPLGGLRGAAQLLHHSLPNAELQEYTDMIITQADRLRDLVNDLLGSQRPSPKQWHNVHRSLERVFQLAELEFGHHLILQRDYDPSLPDVHSIPSHLEQILLNLVRNAAQALEDTPNATIILKTRTEQRALLNGQQHTAIVRIDVIDNGGGIPMELQKRIFYPSVTGRKNGSGLGLTIAHRLALELQGTLSVESQPQHTQFTLRLPFTHT